MVAYAAIVAGQDVTADDINGLIQVTMPWTDLSSLGTFGGAFSNGPRTPQMQKVWYAGTETWNLQGRISASAFAAATVLTLFTFNTGFKVGSEREFSVGGSNSAHYPVRLGFLNDGSMTASVPTAAGSGTNGVWLDGISITNPLA